MGHSIRLDEVKAWPSEPASIKLIGWGFDNPKNEKVNIVNNYRKWTTSDEKTFFPCKRTAKQLTPGVYEIKLNNSGYFFERIPTKTEGLVRFPDSTSDIIIDEIQKFWGLEEEYLKRDIIYRRNILMYGDPGGGKSSIINLMKEDVIKRDGIVVNFSCNPYEYIEGMRIFRQIQPKTPVVTIMEDIDEIMNVHNRSSVLNLLDGINSISNIVYLATTNYADRLEDRVCNRPSRFDKRFKIDMPNADCRKVYFEFLCSKAKDSPDLDKWVEDTEGFSIAHLKELFISVVILGNPYKEALKTLNKMSEDVSRENKGQLGFA